jgi:hypothetical protein
LISRKTVRLIAEAYERAFQNRRGVGSSTYHYIDTARLYDFLFDDEFSGFFCNEAKNTFEVCSTHKFKEFIMKPHTGESSVIGTPEWSWEQRSALGQS